jgi:hypothetical protein
MQEAWDLNLNDKKKSLKNRKKLKFNFYTPVSKKLKTLNDLLNMKKKVYNKKI